MCLFLHRAGAAAKSGSAVYRAKARTGAGLGVAGGVAGGSLRSELHARRYPNREAGGGGGRRAASARATVQFAAEAGGGRHGQGHGPPTEPNRYAHNFRELRNSVPALGDPGPTRVAKGVWAEGGALRLRPGVELYR